MWLDERLTGTSKFAQIGSRFGGEEAELGRRDHLRLNFVKGASRLAQHLSPFARCEAALSLRDMPRD